MTDYTVTRVLDSVAKTCGEGPFWEEVTGTLYFVSIMDGEVHLWSEANDFHDTVQVGEKPGDTVSFAIPCERGGFLAGLNRSIVHCDWEAGQLQRRVLHVVDPDEPVRFNDAKCDPSGRLLANTMSLEREAAVLMKHGVASIYGLDLAGGIKRLDTGFNLGNGMGWHGSKFFFTDSVNKEIYAYDWDAEGFAATNRQVAVNFAAFADADQIGLPDGLAVDATGHLWVACFFGSRVLCIDPEVGKIVRQVALPVPNITSCCFGGEGLGDLFVTTANNWGVKSGEPVAHAGSVYRVTGLGVRGTPSVHYKGAL